MIDWKREPRPHAGEGVEKHPIPRTAGATLDLEFATGQPRRDHVSWLPTDVATCAVEASRC
jgi:hypothetical protein